MCAARSASILCAFFVAAIGAAVGGGCGAGTSSQDPDLAGKGIPDGGLCAPGGTQSCACLGGGEGTQTCRATGSSYGPCTGCASGGGTLDMATSCGDCDGCCDGPNCVPFATQSTTSCGQRGQACQACGGTQSCSTTSGQCFDASGCASCRPGVTCELGACTNNLDPGASFKVFVRTLQLTPKAPGGDSWDGFGGGEADPQVCVYVQAGGTPVQGCTQYVTGVPNGSPVTSIDGTFDDTSGEVMLNGAPFLVPGSALIAGTVRLIGQDNDSPLTPDIAADFPFMATTYMSSYSTGSHGNVVDLVFELR